MELTPIQNALETISTKTQVLLEQISSPNPQTKTLQPVLSGAVNPGIPYILY